MSDTDAHGEDITGLLVNARDGDAGAVNELFDLMVRDLKDIARGKMRSEQPGHTLQATALVNEACVRLIQQDVLTSARDRRYLFGAANRAMQQVLVDHARERSAVKRGGDAKRVAFDVILDSFQAENGVAFEDLYNALEDLGKDSPRQRELIEHRFFGGLSIEETAELMEISPATAKRGWTLARAKLNVAMKRLSE